MKSNYDMKELGFPTKEMKSVKNACPSEVKDFGKNTIRYGLEFMII
jgi:hypothetical protein